MNSSARHSPARGVLCRVCRILVQGEERAYGHVAQPGEGPLELHVGLGADEQDGHAGGVVLDLGPPLGLDVVEGVGRNDGEGDEEDVL